MLRNNGYVKAEPYIPNIEKYFYMRVWKCHLLVLKNERTFLIMYHRSCSRGSELEHETNYLTPHTFWNGTEFYLV